MDGLIVKQPYADMIADGTKTWELRSRLPPKNKINSNIFLLSRGYSLGIIRIIKVTGPLSINDLNNNNDKHRSGTGWSLDDDVPITYAWHIHVVERFQPSRKYAHPNGAQVWVKNVQSKISNLKDYCDDRN